MEKIPQLSFILKGNHLTELRIKGSFIYHRKSRQTPNMALYQGPGVQRTCQ